MTALVVSMEPETLTLSSRDPKLTLKHGPNNKVQVLLDTGSNGDLYFHRGAKAFFPSWLVRPSEHMEGARSESSSLVILQVRSTWYWGVHWFVLQ